MGCVVKYCDSRSRKENCQDLSFHYFPKDKLRKSKWINLIGRSNWTPKKNSRVCSKHFTVDSFKCYEKVKHRRLKHNAIPTLLFDDEEVDEVKVINKQETVTESTEIFKYKIRIKRLETELQKRNEKCIRHVRKISTLKKQVERLSARNEDLYRIIDKYDLE